MAIPFGVAKRQYRIFPNRRVRVFEKSDRRFPQAGKIIGNCFP